MTDSGSEPNDIPIDLVPLPGSERQAPGGIQPAAEAPAGDATVEATVILRRRATMTTEDALGQRLTSTEIAARFGADPADAEVVERTFTSLGLRILETDLASRRIRI